MNNSMLSELLLIRCPVCGNDKNRELFQKQGFHIVCCSICNLVFVNPRLSKDALKRLYNSDVISKTEYYLSTAEEDKKSFIRRLNLIERYCNPGRLLDIGCGPGIFMSVAKERGWAVFGVDINTASVEQCSKIDLKVTAGAFPHHDLENQLFNVIVMNDAIEHFSHPRQVLAEAYKLLETGGLLFISTPDIKSLIARVSGSRWLHMKPIEHLTYFDRNTISRLLAEVGFKVLHYDSIGRYRSLRLIIDRISTYSSLLSRIISYIIPTWFSRHISVPVNPGDEMVIIAQRS
ncbi:MAG: class I SAM-dependent methyltransferase [Patescibacteria group bacterium]